MRLALFAALLLLATPARAVCVDCACADITVTSDTRALAEAACDTAARTLDRLAAAGLTDVPALEIVAVSEIPTEGDGLAGLFEADTHRITVLAPEALARQVSPTSAFAILAPETQFAGIVAHELTHALLVAKYGPRKNFAAHEYVAYAFQVDMMPESERARFLDAVPIAGSVSPAALGDLVLLMAPDAFAARAWAFFQAEGAGAETIEKAMTGGYRFPSMFHGLD